MAQDIEKTNNQMLDELFQAVDVITAKRLENLQFDKTITCQIIDNSDAEKGEYVVSDGSTEFKAYSENSRYREGSWVYVTIPNGDFSADKYIVGKYISENTEYSTYLNPFDTYIDITGNLLTNDSETVNGLIANNPDKKEIVLWRIGEISLVPQSYSGEEKVDAIDNTVSEITQQFSNFDRLGFRAEFKTLLEHYNIAAGEYGLRLDIVAMDPGSTSTSRENKFYNVKLNTNNMFGNPYNFLTWSQQQCVIDISNFESIVGMQLVFYQNNDFINIDNKRIPLINTEDQTQWDAYLSMANILSRNIYISLGYDLSQFTEDQLFLYSFEPSTYGSYLTETTRESLNIKHPELNLNIEEDTQIGLQYVNEKNLHLRWVHVDDESGNVYAIDNIDDISVWENDNFDLISTAKIHWYRWRLEDGIEDSLAGVFWEEVNLTDHKAKLEAPEGTDFSNWVERPNQYDCFDWEYFYPNPMSPNEKIKVIVEYPTMDFIEYNFKNDLPAFLENLPEEVLKEEQLYNEEYIQQINSELIDLEDEYIAAMETAADLYSIGSEEYYYAIEVVQQKYRKIFEEYTQELQVVLDEEGIEENLVETYWSPIQEAIEGFHVSYLNQCTFYESEILEFTNEHEVPDQLSMELVRALQIICDADPNYGLNGVYHIYNTNGQIMNAGEASKWRFLSAQFDTIITGDKKLDKAETIKWYIPVENTMIEYPAVDCEFVLAIDTTEIETQLVTLRAELAQVQEQYRIQQETYTEEEILEHPELRNRISELSSQIDELQNQIDQNETNKQASNFATFAGLDDSGEWFCIERQGVAVSEDRAPGEIVPTQLEQIFRVKSYYAQTAINNTVRCEVYKNNKTYSAEYTMYFGVSGSNGTDYTLTTTYQELKNGEWVPMVTPVVDWRGGPVKLVPHVFDYENIEITDDYNDNLFSYALYSSPGNNGGLEIEQYGRDCIITHTDAIDRNLYYHYIIELTVRKAVTVKTDLKTIEELKEEGYTEAEARAEIEAQEASGLEVDLTTYCPLAIRFDSSIFSMDGDNKIIYDPSGVNPTYYKGQYTLYKIVDNKPTKQNNVVWSMQIEDEIDATKYYPQIDANTGELVVPTMFMSDNDPRVSILALIDSEVVWCQPLHIYQEVYGSTMMNSWDGSLTIDEDRNTIMSAMVGAGFKDDLNRFHGVLMGQVGKITGVGSISKDTGVFGYHEGAQSFGLRINGTAFLGKQGRGQILFEGNTGQIKSAFFGKTTLDGLRYGGMRIDLDDAYIDFQGDQFFDPDGEVDTSGNRIKRQALIHIGVTGDNADPYFSITDNINSTTIIRIDNNSQYLQSSDFSENYTTNDFSGIKFDLRHGRLTGYDFVLKALHQPDNTNYKIGIIVSSGVVENGAIQPYIRVTDNASWTGAHQAQTVLEISQTQFYLQSSNFHEDYANNSYSGTKFDVKNGKITSYSFNLQARQSKIIDNQSTFLYIKLNSDENINSYPFEIGHWNDISLRFKVDWDGNIFAYGGKIGGWTFNTEGLFAATPTSSYYDLALYSSNMTTPSGDPYRITVGGSVQFDTVSRNQVWSDTDDQGHASSGTHSFEDHYSINASSSPGLAITRSGILRANKSELANCTIGGKLNVTGDFYVEGDHYAYDQQRVVTSVSGGVNTWVTYTITPHASYTSQEYVTDISIDWNYGFQAPKDSVRYTTYTFTPVEHSEASGVSAGYGRLYFLGLYT